jgi:hypothetical protein
MEEIEKEKTEKSIHYAVREKTTSYILAAFSLVAGLAWNEAIKSFIEFVFPQSGNSLMAKFAYALALTVVVVYVSVYLSKIFKKETEG